MNHIPISSSHIKSIGYDKNSKTLEIKFYTDKVFKYQGVAEPTFNNLKNADSVGKYYHTYIKGNYHTEELK